MANEIIINWIKEKIIQGYSVDQLRDSLLAKGHHPSDVETALKLAVQQTPSINQSSRNKGTEDNQTIANNPIWIFLILALIIGIVVLGISLYQQETIQTNTTSNLTLDSNSSLVKGQADSTNIDSGESETLETTSSLDSEKSNSNIICENFPNKLRACKPYVCEYVHPFTGELMNREIKGLTDGNCIQEEELPGNLLMICNFDKSLRMAVAQYYEDSLNVSTDNLSIGTSGSIDDLTYLVNGEEVSNPLQKAMDDKLCILKDKPIDPTTNSGCKDFPDKLRACESFSCNFTDPENGVVVEHTIKGLVEGECVEHEQFPMGIELNCELNEEYRTVFAQYYEDILTGKAKKSLEETNIYLTYKLGEEEINYPIQKAVDDDVCVMSNAEGFANLK